MYIMGTSPARYSVAAVTQAGDPSRMQMECNKCEAGSTIAGYSGFCGIDGAKPASG
jgi:hypothetical protein